MLYSVNFRSFKKRGGKDEGYNGVLIPIAKESLWSYLVENITDLFQTPGIEDFDLSSV